MADEDDLEDEVSRNEIANAPSEAGDPQWLVDDQIPADLREKYEVYSYRSAATILAVSHPQEFAELCEALREFVITKTMIRTAGGNESDIPKLLSASLRPKGWRETLIRGERPKWAVWGNQADDSYTPTWNTYAYNSTIAAE